MTTIDTERFNALVAEFWREADRAVRP